MIGVAFRVRLEVLARAVRAECRPHRREQVAAHPDTRVHRQRDRDVVGAQHPARRIALPAALLALRRDRHRAAGGRDALVGVTAQRGRVDVDGAGCGEPVLVHEPHAVIAGGSPDAGVGRHGRAEITGHLECGALGELGVARHVEGHLEPEHVVAARDATRDEVLELRLRRPLPRTSLDVPVGEDEAAGHRLERVNGCVGVLDRLQAVRPVHGGRDPGVERLDAGQQVAGVDVLRAEHLSEREVVPDEVLGEGPVGAVPAHRGLPHVPVRVDHPGHDDPPRGVDLDRPLWNVERRTNRRQSAHPRRAHQRRGAPTADRPW